jgi:hypothetical protein
MVASSPSSVRLGIGTPPVGFRMRGAPTLSARTARGGCQQSAARPRARAGG